MTVTHGQKYFKLKRNNVMKLGKRIISIALCAVLLVSTVCMMVSCNDEAKPIETINGVSPMEACFVSFAQLASEDSYHVSVDAKIMINAVVTTIPVGVDEFYDYTLDGDNMHYKFTDQDLLFIENEKILSLFSGYDKEVWYVDGVRYSITADGQKVIGNKVPSNIVGKVIDTITADIPEAPECYEQDGEQYVLMKVSLEEFSAEPMDCRIFINEDFKVYKAEVEGNLYGFDVVLAMNFEYGSFAPVTLPANVNEFKAVK